MNLNSDNKYPDSKVHGANPGPNPGPTRVLSAAGGTHISPMDLAIWVYISLLFANDNNDKKKKNNNNNNDNDNDNDNQEWIHIIFLHCDMHSNWMKLQIIVVVNW